MYLMTNAAWNPSTGAARRGARRTAAGAAGCMAF